MGQRFSSDSVLLYEKNTKAQSSSFLADAAQVISKAEKWVVLREQSSLECSTFS